MEKSKGDKEDYEERGRGLQKIERQIVGRMQSMREMEKSKWQKIWIVKRKRMRERDKMKGWEKRKRMRERDGMKGREKGKKLKLNKERWGENAYDGREKDDLKGKRAWIYINTEEYRVEELKGSAELYQNSNPNWISLIRPGLCWEKFDEFPVKDPRYRETNHSGECDPAEQGSQHLQVLCLRYVEEREGSEEEQE